MHTYSSGAPAATFIDAFALGYPYIACKNMIIIDRAVHLQNGQFPCHGSYSLGE